MNYTNSLTQQISFNNQKYFVKRDDLLHKDFSGNKARKFYYFLKNDFTKIKKVISFGSAQSNAMYSLSVLCKIKGWEFDYYVDHIASFLKENPVGTVIGVYKSFEAITQNGLGDPTIFSNGIGIALITTIAGLIVAIPHQIAYNHFISLIDSIELKAKKEISE